MNPGIELIIYLIAGWACTRFISCKIDPCQGLFACVVQTLFWPIILIIVMVYCMAYTDWPYEVKRFLFGGN